MSTGYLSSRRANDSDPELSDDDDALFAALERDDDDLSADIRERRVDELKRDMARQMELKNCAYGTYDVIATEMEVLNITTTIKNCVVHFAHKNFRRCQLMDGHLEALSRKHLKTRFIRVDVENAPFLVERLKVKVLPCVVAFIDGKSVDRLIGFEAVGDADNVPTSNVESWLRKAGVLTAEPVQSNPQSIFGFPSAQDSDDDY
ncbi:thioredoxin-like protein [Fimicolochytrium jonesii]|uniref:thioredoxin-like protein n=1 Tax=Fimicolochytrium jonesii TaxID=1396493 RepID=UPI0022FE1C4D|nr:thioredoxin-like protein [Fimicolochytrium jonesii]KAI8823446.1 thioredoxin-like protein [Fimicolochytrium jonesii]